MQPGTSERQSRGRRIGLARLTYARKSTAMNIRQVDWESQDWRVVRPGVERKAFSGDGVTLALHGIWPGHDVVPYSHPIEQVVYIIEGEADFQIGDRMVRLRAGGVALVPPNVTHFIRVVGTSPVLDLEVFCAARPDYDV